jgi:hypothetical protein
MVAMVVAWEWNISGGLRETNQMSIGKRIRWNVLNATRLRSSMATVKLIQRDLREKQSLPA